MHTLDTFTICEFLSILEGAAHYAGLLLAPAEGFGLRPRFFSPSVVTLDQGLSKHQEVGSTPVTKVKKIILNFWNLLGAIKK